MKEAIVYICHNKEDILEAVELSELNPQVYGHHRANYPWYVGWREDDGELYSVSTDNSQERFSHTDWFQGAIEVPVIDLYKELGMKS